MNINLPVNEKIQSTGLATMTAGSDYTGNTLLDVKVGDSIYQIIATQTGAKAQKTYKNKDGIERTINLASLVITGTERSVATVSYAAYSTSKGQGVRFTITPKCQDFKALVGNVEHMTAFLSSGKVECDFYEDKQDKQPNNQGRQPYAPQDYDPHAGFGQ